MRLISRYVCRRFLAFLLLAWGACTGLSFLVELFDRLDEFIERQVLWQDALRYLGLKLPQMMYTVLPAAFLFASVLTFSSLSKHNELVAIRAAGLAPLHLTRPLLVLGGIGCLLMLAAQEYLLPYTNQAYRLIWRTRVRHEKLDVRLGLFRRGHIWYRAGTRIWSVQLSQPLAGRLLGVTIYELDAAGTIRRRYDVAEAQWQPSGWLLFQGTLRQFDAQGNFAAPPERFAVRRVLFSERPTEISALRREPDEMGIREGLAYARQLRRQGVENLRYLVTAHGQVAFAAVCIIMAGFGVPLALQTNRSGSMTKAVGISLFCGLGYWVIHALAMALGYHGFLSPILAAWTANGWAAAGSVYLARRTW